MSVSLLLLMKTYYEAILNSREKFVMHNLEESQLNLASAESQIFVVYMSLLKFSIQMKNHSWGLMTIATF